MLSKLIEFAQKWSHSKLGWLGNKLALAFGTMLSKSGIDGGDTAEVLAGAVVLFLATLLEFGVKVASDKLVGGLQRKSAGVLDKDNWPGPQTRGYVGVK